jgi:RimJ/RimL family protein N-acetyltransferase
MTGAAFLRSDRVTLRTVEPADYDFIHRHWNDPEVRRGFARHEPRTREDVAEYFADAEDAVHFVACRNDDRLGFVWLFEVDDAAGRAELGYWVTPDEQGNGYATEIATLGVRYAFAERGLGKVFARVLDWNDASRRVLEKVGFRQEGHLRDHYYVDGEQVDAYLYAILKSDGE